MNRFAACGVLLAIGPLAFAQDLSKKISLEIPASRASIALAALGRAAGITLEPAGNVRDDVFVISVHDATVDDIMRRVAQAEAGKWVLQSGVYLLTRDHTTTVEQERAETKARAAVIAKAIAELNASVTKSGKFDDSAAQKLSQDTHRVLDQALQGPGAPGKRIDVSGIGDNTPTGRAIARLLASIDPLKLAKIAPNQRVVFSTDPTPMQQSLSGAGDEAFRRFVEEQAIYAKAYNANQPADGTTRVAYINGIGSPSMGSGDPKLGLGVGLVVIQSRFAGALSVQILAADPKGDTISTGNYTLQLSQPEPPTPAAGNDEPLKISDEAKEMAQAIGPAANGILGGGGIANVRMVSVGGSGGDFTIESASSGNGAPKISPALRAKALDPVNYEPLAFVPGEAMLALARSSNKNVVALLPDTCFGSLTRQFAGNVTAAQLLASLATSHALLAKQDDAWIVVSPQLPATARANKVNRVALKALLKAMDKSASLRLDDIATFALAQDKAPGLNDFDILYPRLINAAEADQSLMQLAMGSDSLFKFYGTLSPGQRQDIASGQRMPFMNFSQQQSSFVADMVFNSPQGPNVQLDSPGGQQPPGLITSTIISQGGGPVPMIFAGGWSAKTERTIVLPNGITSDGYMVGNVNSQQVVQGIDSKTGQTQMLDPSSLAFSRNAPNQPDFPGFAPNQFDKYKLAHRSTISLRFFFTPRVTMARSLSDSATDDNAEPMPYDSLPANFRQRVDQIAQQVQRAMQKVPGRGGATPPPLP